MEKRRQEFLKYGVIAIGVVIACMLKTDENLLDADTDKSQQSKNIDIQNSNNSSKKVDDSIKMNWPHGDPNCKHIWDNKKSAITYNDETMGGCGSCWDWRCDRCGYVEK